MGILVGSTGFVGGHLARSHEFDVQVHRSDLETIVGMNSELLVCAGLPAEKWKANLDPQSDWANTSRLAQVLASVQVKRAVLISTIDVYQPPVQVDEMEWPAYAGPQPYGAHRAWFEAFFRTKFPESLILRLPGLFASDLRKNLLHDLLHGKKDQINRVNPKSTFQYFDMTNLWKLVERATRADLRLLNVSTQPIKAEVIADIFGVKLNSESPIVHYDMRSMHAAIFGGIDGYLYSEKSILEGIVDLSRLSTGR